MPIESPRKETVVFLMGATATGKTDLAVDLVRHGAQDGRAFEIISVDSAMVYRGMDIGTAKPDAATQEIAPHRLIDIRDPSEAYSVAEFRHDALAAIAEIHGAGRIPLLVGGTMMYFRVLLDGLSVLPPSNPEIRARLQQELADSGREALAHRLAAVDPEAAKKHGENPQRLLRALEVFEITGTPLTQLQAETAPAGDAFPFRTVQVGLGIADRSVLAKRIARRFRAMLAGGLLEEVAGLRERPDIHPDLPALRAVGYRQVWQFLDGQCSYDEMESRGIIATRQFAKRQMTWLRGWEGLHTLESGPDGLFRKAQELIATQAV